MRVNFNQGVFLDEEEPQAEAPAVSRRVDFTAEPVQARFTEQDLRSPGVYDSIQKYMVRRFGVDYENEDTDKTVNDFLEYQRSLEFGNSADIVKEALFMRRADNETKQIISQAYNAFDSLGGIFSEGSDTLQGLGDYVEAVVTDPITYLGLGVGKVISSAGSRAAAVGLRQAAKAAAQQAMKGVTGVEARRQAGRSAMEQTIKEGLRRRSVQKGLQIGAVEGVTAGGQAFVSEAIRVEGGSKEEVNTDAILLQAVVGAGLGTLGSIAVDRWLDPSQGLSLRYALQTRPSKAQAVEFKKEALEEVIKSLAIRTDWQEAAQQGRNILGVDKALPTEWLEKLLMGDADIGTRGINQAMVASGLKFTSPRYSYKVVDFLKDLPADVKKQFDQLFEQTTIGVIKSVDEFADTFAATIRKAAQDSNVVSQASQAYNRAYNRALISERSVGGTLPDAAEAASDKLGEVLGTSWDAYFRNVWKRLLVSSFPTTAVNVLGSSIYVAGQTAQDLVLLPRMMFKKDGWRQHKKVMLDRFKFLFSPTANREVVEQMTKLRPDALEAFYNVTNMGVRSPKDLEEIYKAFNVTSETSKKGVALTERIVNGAQALSLVHMQDSFFKTFGLMDNLNRALMKKHGRGIEDVILSGDFRKLVTDDDLGQAAHDTLKMTFSADYTRRNRAYNKTNAWLGRAAEMVELISNSPLGFVFPFGRFMNNIVATTYQYSPVAWMPEVLPKVVEAVRKRSTTPLSAVDQDIVTKSIVGMGALFTSFEMARERLENTDDPWWVVRNGAERTDVKNVYPASAILLFGDIAYRLSRGETLPTDLIRDLGDQIAIGQAARDLNVSDVVEGIFTTVFGSIEDIIAGRTGSAFTRIGTNLGSASGEILAGLTRPLTTLDDMVGFITDDLQTYDRRQIDVDNALFDSFAMGATRYTSKITEAINQMMLGGEPPDDFEFQRDATRVGKKEQSDLIGKNFSGLSTLGRRTHTEKMFDMAGIPYWTANWRSRHPEFNRLANEVYAPLLNEYARHAIRDERFINMNASERRVFIQGRLRQIEKEVEARIKAGPNPSHIEWHVERTLMNARDNPRTRDRYNMALNRLGFTQSDPRKMSMAEKFQLNEYLEALQNFYQ